MHKSKGGRIQLQLEHKGCWVNPQVLFEFPFQRAPQDKLTAQLWDV